MNMQIKPSFVVLRAFGFLLPLVISLAGCQPDEPLESAPAPSTPAIHSKATTLRGFIDKSGNFVIKPQFVTASSFHEGLAHVVDPRGSFIDKSGNFVIKKTYYVAGDFTEGLASAAVPKPGSSWADVNRPGDQLLYGYIDKTGNFVIPPKYKAALDFSEGLAAVMPQNSKSWGFIDKHGTMVIPARFSIGLDDMDRDLPSFRHGVALVTAESGKAIIDKTGTALDKAKADKIKSSLEYDEEGFKPISENKHRGYINKRGDVIGADFDLVTPFHEGLALVRIPGSKWGFIDRSGKFIVEPSDRFEYEHFSEGMCLLKESSNQYGSFGYIDRTGKLVISLRFPNAEYFHEGLAAVGVPATQKQLDQIKLPFTYIVQGNSLTFPMKFSDKDDSAPSSSQ